MKIILASASPRRKELLRQIGLDFTVQVSSVEEKVTATVPYQVVEELSRRKAVDVYAQNREYLTGDSAEAKKRGDTESEGADGNTEYGADPVLVIGADTIVACDGEILGKPKDEQDAFRMLSMLQGRSHQVYTGVTFCFRKKDRDCVYTFHEVTQVECYPMTESEIHAYIATGEPMDKAGAYGIQGICAKYIKGIQGDYNNVVGLPIARLYQELRKTFMKKAVIFDLDGTLSDSLASIKYCADLAVAPLGMGPFTPKQYKYFVGDGAANLIKRCLVAGGDEELVHFEEAFAGYREIFRENCMYQVKPYEGIPELLKALKERGLGIAVLSNKPHAETIQVIETLFGKGYFDVIQGQKPEVAIKPSPEGVFRILEQLDLTADDILYVGDTGTDMKTGKSAGAFTVGALWGFRERKELEENQADVVIENPLQLLDYME